MLKDAEPDVGGDGVYVDGNVLHGGVCEKKGEREAMICVGSYLILRDCVPECDNIVILANIDDGFLNFFA